MFATNSDSIPITKDLRRWNNTKRSKEKRMDINFGKNSIRRIIVAAAIPTQVRSEMEFVDDWQIKSQSRQRRIPETLPKPNPVESIKTAFGVDTNWVSVGRFALGYVWFPY
jgi:acetylglutamate synthase